MQPRRFHFRFALLLAAVCSLLILATSVGALASRRTERRAALDYVSSQGGMATVYGPPIYEHEIAEWPTLEDLSWMFEEETAWTNLRDSVLELFEEEEHLSISVPGHLDSYADYLLKLFPNADISVRIAEPLEVR